MVEIEAFMMMDPPWLNNGSGFCHRKQGAAHIQVEDLSYLRGERTNSRRPKR
jgi:hypothetical protein